MSAPIVSGRWIAGDANVLSTTISGRRPPSAARRSTVPATSAISTVLSKGLVGDSNQTSRVRSDSASHSASIPAVRSMKVGVTPPPGLRTPRDSVRAAVHVVADDDLLARIGQLGDGGGRRGPRREREPVAAALELGDRPLEPFAGGVLRAGVLVAPARLADRVLLVGRCLVDRRRDGAGQLVGLGAGVDGQRIEGQRRRGRSRGMPG